MDSLPPLVGHAFKMQEAVLCLFKNDFRLAGLMLIFTTIDQMAWLSLADDDEVKGKDFMAWVDAYMLGRSNRGLESVTAGDLWGARCGLLHTATPESRSLRNGTAANKIAYTYGTVAATPLVPGWACVRVEDLVASFVTGVLRFKDELEADQDRNRIVNDKLCRMVLDQPV